MRARVEHPSAECSPIRGPLDDADLALIVTVLACASHRTCHITGTPTDKLEDDQTPAGRTGILGRQGREDWGSGTTKRLSSDLRRVFPDMNGLSETNLRHMLTLAQAWPDWEVCSQVVSKLPWGHNLELAYKLADGSVRLWYAHQAFELGWSRKVLQVQIATDLRGRQGGALTSFDRSLPPPDSELVRDAIKDPYNFEFLGLSAEARERSVTRELS